MTAETFLIGADHNTPFDELENITSLPPTGEQFAEPKVLPLYDDGAVHQRLNIALFEGGYASVTWFFTRMTYEQLAYLKSTFCSGGLSGEVTIYTQLGDVGYSRMNATMQIKKPKEIQSQYWYKNVEVLFILQGAAA